MSDKIKDEEIRIDRCTVQRLDRSNQKGGGCLIYYREYLDVIPKPKLEVKLVEATWIEVICRSQRLLIGTVYRPPKDKDFYDTFNKILDDLWTKRNNILLIGDFNSDLMTRNKNDQGKKLQRILNMFGLKNVIKRPTRVAASSETIIDLIISSESLKVIESESLDPGISPKMVKNYKTMNIDEFKKPLEDTLWWVTNIYDDVDDVAYTKVSWMIM